jgi:glycosyltransferase involved in cell wall biosynthesis
MLRIATAVPTWPFYNYRYRKLLFDLAKRFCLRIFAGSTLPAGNDDVLRPVRVLPFRLPRKIRYYISPLIAELALSVVEEADVVWLFGIASPFYPHFLGAPIVLDTDDPKVVLPKEQLSRIPKLSLVNEWRLLRNRKIRKVVVPTELIRRKFITLGLDEDRVTVIPNGVDTSLFYPTPLPKEPVVLYYGTFQPHRARLLLEVIEVLARKKRDVKFLLIGDIPSSVRYRLQRVAENRVEMPGFVEHDLLPRYIQMARVCILPQDRSLGLGGSLKLLEYMASGRPIVATNVDESFPLKESGAGIVTEIDAEAMAEAVIRLLDDDRLSEELARKGVEYAQKYEWSNIVEQYVKLFYQVHNSQ